MNQHNQDQSKNNGKHEQSKGAEHMSQKHSKESSEKEPQGEARSFMQGRAFRVLCAAGAMLMVYRMGRRVMARRRAREARRQ